MKQRFSDWVLRRKLNSLPERRRKTFNLQQARTIGLIFEGGDPTKNRIVQDFIRFLIEERKEIFAMAFINKKEIDDSYQPMKEVTAFGNKDLNLLKFPTKIAPEFFEKDIDILIDLSINNSTPLKYLFCLSPAKFKVSAGLTYQRKYGDMTIELTKNKGLEYLIEQITYYLNQVNSKNKAYAV